MNAWLPAVLLSFGVSFLANAQTSTTEPVGFIRVDLQAGNNFVGFSLMSSKVHHGAITVSSTDRRRIVLSNATVTEDQFNPAVVSSLSQATHVIEIVSEGASQGLHTAIVDTIANGPEVVLQEPLLPGVADGSQIYIWKLWTIGDAFGSTNSAGLTSTNSSSTSDLILIPTDSGYAQYYYSAGGFAGVGWRRIGEGSADQRGVPLYFTDGFLIVARTAKSVNLVGSVKPGQTKVVLETGNNFLANLCPVNAGGANPSALGRTLGNSNLYNGTANGLSGATSFGAADMVLISNGSGFNQFYYSTGGFVGTGWRQVGQGSVNKSDTALPEGSFIVFRRGAPTMVTLSQPTF
jgi:uncharacterized protein (TIGR02597 family)